MYKFLVDSDNKATFTIKYLQKENVTCTIFWLTNDSDNKAAFTNQIYKKKNKNITCTIFFRLPVTIKLYLQFNLTHLDNKQEQRHQYLI